MSTSRRKFLQSTGAASLLTLPPMWSQKDATDNRNPMLSKLSLNVYSFNQPLRDGQIDLFDVLDFCAEHHFAAVDPTGYYFPGYPSVPDDEYLFRFKKKAFLLGLDISGTGVRNNFMLADQSDRLKSVELVYTWIKAAAKMGIPNVRVFTGVGQYEPNQKEQLMEWTAEALRHCCLYAKQYGVMVALQNHNELLKTADDVDQLISMVDSEWLGLNLDIGSYRVNNPYEDIQQNVKHAITWQIKENVWIDGKQTPTDFDRLMKIIQQSGYRGYLPIETLGAGDPFKKIPVLLDNVRTAITNLD